MQHHGNDERLSNNDAARLGDVYAPSSLLPDVLRRLGLANEQAAPVEEANLLADPGYGEWYVRAAAVRELGKLKEQAPLAPLLAALADPHVSVRATAVHILGTLGERVPVESLVQALRDSEWQVRESAAFALGTLGESAPAAPLLAALNDPDGAVREAARAALRQTYPDMLSQAAPGSLLQERSRTRGTIFAAFLATGRNVYHLIRAKSGGQLYHSREGNSMRETDLYSEETHHPSAGSNSSINQPEQFKRPGRPRNPAWRIAGVSLAIVVVLVNVVAWLILSHTLQRGTQTGHGGIAPGNSPTAALTPIGTSTPVATPAQNYGPVGKTLYTYKDPTQAGDFMSLGWSPDGTRIAVGAMDVRAWDATTGKHLKVYDPGTNASVLAVNWSPDGTRIAESSSNVQIFDATTGNRIVTFTPASQLGNLSSRTGNPMARLSGGNMIYASAWSPDGKMIASAVYGASYGYNVQVWEAANGQHIRTFQIKPGGNSNDYITSVAWSPDGKLLAAAGADQVVKIWNVATGSTVLTYTGHRETVNSLSWSPNGKFIASAGNTVQVWNAKTGQTVYTYRDQPGGASVAIWSPDGTRIASGGRDVRVWDATTGQHLFVYTGHGNHQYLSIRALAWSPNGKLIASLGTGMDITAPHTGIPLDAVKVWVAA